MLVLPSTDQEDEEDMFAEDRVNPDKTCVTDILTEDPVNPQTPLPLTNVYPPQTPEIKTIPPVPVFQSTQPVAASMGEEDAAKPGDSMEVEPEMPGIPTPPASPVPETVAETVADPVETVADPVTNVTAEAETVETVADDEPPRKKSKKDTTQETSKPPDTTQANIDTFFNPKSGASCSLAEDSVPTADAETGVTAKDVETGGQEATGGNMSTPTPAPIYIIFVFKASPLPSAPPSAG